MERVEVREECTECGGKIVTVDLESVCSDCGLVLGEDAIDRGPDWGRSNGETDTRRTGAPLERSRHDRGLSTEIGFGTDVEVSGAKQRQLVRMRREHSRARFASKAERNRAYGFTEIRRIVSALSLPTSVREQACMLFESAQTEDLLCGRSLEGFSAASVYATCRVRSIARTIDEIVAVARADANELKAAYGALNRELGLPVGPISPVEYLPRYASALELAADVECRAREYARTLLEEGVVGGKNPSGVAAACLYMAAYDLGDTITQTEVAELAGVSRMTVRSTATEIKELS